MARIPRVMVSTDWLAQALAAPASAPAFTAEQAHRLTHVLRLTPGAEIEVFADGQGAFRGRLAGDAAHGWRLTDLRPVSADAGTAADTAVPAVTVACGWPRAKRADFLIEKLVELGVTTLQPLIFERSERGEHFGTDKAARYDRLIAKACEQCRRNDRLTLAPAQPWSVFLTATDPDTLRLICTGAADQAAPGLSAALHAAAAAGSMRTVTLVVGPEGGLTAAEIAAGTVAGWQPVRLGGLTLRVETAAIAAAAVALQMQPAR